jgi:hypothetical protein
MSYENISLPNELRIHGIVCPMRLFLSTSVKQFKNKLDKFWSGQELMFNYKADLTGVGI